MLACKKVKKDYLDLNRSENTLNSYSKNCEVHLNIGCLEGFRIYKYKNSLAIILVCFKSKSN